MARKRARSSSQSATDRREYARRVDSDDEAPNSESQQMLALRPLLTKQKSNDKEVEQFRKEVETYRDVLNDLLQQRKIQNENDAKRRRDEIATATCEALGFPNRSIRNNVSAYAGTHIAGNAVCASVVDILGVSEGLVKECQRLDSIIQNLQDEDTESVVNKWKQSMDEAEDKLRVGARVAQRKVLKALGADMHHIEELGSGSRDEDDGVMEQAEDKDSNWELQKTLRYTERAVKKMVKGLPDDETI